MHLIVPYAYSHAQGCQEVWPSLALPNLQALLARLTPQPLVGAGEQSLSPPHEVAWAAALGLRVADGLLPWAAQSARALAQGGADLPADPAGWAYVTLCHWQVHTQQVVLAPLADVTLSETEQLCALMQPYWHEDGIALWAESAGRLLAHGLALLDLPSASLERVQGRNLAAWMPEGAQAAVLRRLHNEMQMLLYTHPLFDARQSRGQTPINGFWLSGTGTPHIADPAAAARAAPRLLLELQAPALRGDWAAWAQAWAALDAGVLRQTLQAGVAPGFALTLCGERCSQTWLAQPQRLWHKVQEFFGPKPSLSLLEVL
jgi:hypothetical protein